ncbi:MAG: chorismate-binding protein [Muribaculaceae bacterium]
MINNTQALSAIEKAVKYNTHFFAYRLPGDEEIHFGAQIIDQRTSVGFFIHPFVETANTPCCFISSQLNAEKYLKMPQSALPKKICRAVDANATTKEEYIDQADRTITALKSGEYRKIVLSRTIYEAATYDEKKWTEVFNTLTIENPNAFVFIFNTEETGFWLGASPEKYLSYNDKTLATMALAGTRLCDTQDSWGDKEIEEQKMVSDYIATKFDEANIEYEMSPIYTRKAGGIEHLCNDFTANVSKPTNVDTMRSSLHPTPALAGIPSTEAIKFIGNTELHSRRYYGGYIGPFDAAGNFNLYVNLRSLEFDGNGYCIYAGGGLTADSISEQEWQETAHKSQTLLKAITI